MPICPNCHTEYRDNFTVCSDCGAALIPDTSADSPKSPRAKKNRAQSPVKSNSGDRFLVNVLDPVELAYIKSALGELGIPCRVLAEDVSQYLYILHGRSYMGVNVYVPESGFGPANEALASYKALLLPEDAPALAGDGIASEGIRFELWFLRAYLSLNLISSLVGVSFFIGF